MVQRKHTIQIEIEDVEKLVEDEEACEILRGHNRCISVDKNSGEETNHASPSIESASSSMTPQQHRYSGGYLQHRYIHPIRDQNLERREKITINVSGERYQTYVDTLNAFPDTLLGNTLKREEFYDDVEDEYFFDRDRNAFGAILYYYQSKGQLYCPLTVPMTILVSEAKFFNLGKDAIKQVLDLQVEDKKKDMPKNKWQRKIWCLFEHPETSRAARMLTIFSVLMIIFSVIILCIETLPFAKKSTATTSTTTTTTNDNNNNNNTNNIKLIKYFLNIIFNNKSNIQVKITENLNTNYQLNNNLPVDCVCKTRLIIDGDSNITKPIVENVQKIDWHDVFDQCEAVFVVWFTFEFIVRFFCSPNKIEFMKGFLNIIDIISILPFYITSALSHNDSLGLENLRIVRLVRVFRIFKLSRHSKGLQILGKTLQASLRELGLMIFFIAMGVVLFSSAVYYLEIENFSSIPDAFWWAIITMCTVGYGDKVPNTFWGKVVGSACAVCGVLSIALPVPVIVSNFDYFYNRERTRKMHAGFIEEDNEEDIVKNKNSINFENITETKFTESENLKQEQELGSPLLNNSQTPLRNGFTRSVNRSPLDVRTEEIHRQQTIKGLEKRNRKLSQKISEASLSSYSSVNRKHAAVLGRTGSQALI